MRVKVRGWDVRSPTALRELGFGLQAGSKVGCQEATVLRASGTGSRVRSQTSSMSGRAVSSITRSVRKVPR